MVAVQIKLPLHLGGREGETEGDRDKERQRQRAKEGDRDRRDSQHESRNRIGERQNKDKKEGWKENKDYLTKQRTTATRYRGIPECPSTPIEQHDLRNNKIKTKGTKDHTELNSKQKVMTCHESERS